MGAADVFRNLGAKTGTIFTRYQVTIQVRDKLVGGLPKDQDTIRKFLAARLELDEEHLWEVANETIAQMRTDLGREPSKDEILTELTSQENASGNGFKTVDGELVYEGRCLKAALKEASNSTHPGTDWPNKPAGIKKGLMRYLSEVCFVEENYIPLGTPVPSGTEERIKHVMTPQGKRSAINVVDFVDKPILTFHVLVRHDAKFTMDLWSTVWQALEEIGIGADRSRSDGKFDLLSFEEVGEKTLSEDAPEAVSIAKKRGTSKTAAA